MVYIMQCGEFFKIGMSNNPERRRDHIQTSNPLKVQIIAQKDVPDDKALESELHKKYEDYHIRGEWFAMRIDLVNEIINRHQFDKVKDPGKIQEIHVTIKMERKLRREQGRFVDYGHFERWKAYKEGYFEGRKEGRDSKKQEILSAIALTESPIFNPTPPKHLRMDTQPKVSFHATEHFANTYEIPSRKMHLLPGARWCDENLSFEEAVDRSLDNLESKQPGK